MNSFFAKTKRLLYVFLILIIVCNVEIIRADEINDSQENLPVLHYDITKNGGSWNGETYILDGVIIKNAFFYDGSYTYYLQCDGSPMKNRLTYHPDGEHLIYFDEQGHELFNSFQFCEDVGYTCYFDTNGFMYKDQITFVDGNPYYLDGTGRMKQNEYFCFDNGIDFGLAKENGVLNHNGFGLNPFKQTVFYHWNGMIARGLITDGEWFYDMDITDGHLKGKFHQSILPKWTITQYSSHNNLQHMFYTIEDEQNNLIIIDGGWEENTQQVKDVINTHGNHVTAWIITHPHPDHVGAFNNIITDSEITVDSIYTIQVNQMRYEQTAKDYDMISSYYKWLDVTKNLTNIHYVKENDSFTCLNLTFNVLHAWDESIDMLNSNLLNNGSMCFTVKGNLNSMLFCADIQQEVQQDIIDNHKDSLNVDYVQLAHHGNWGVTTDFYEYTSPLSVFFDCPTHMLDTQSDTYDAGILLDYFKSKGCTIYTFENTHNNIIFR